MNLGQLLDIIVQPVDVYYDPGSDTEIGIYVDVFEYGSDGTIRAVRRKYYEPIRDAAGRGTPNRTLLQYVLPNHFVWSDQLLYVFSLAIDLHFLDFGDISLSEDLSWNPALLGMDALIEECVDLSELVKNGSKPLASEVNNLFRRSRAGGWDIRFEAHACGPYKDSKGLRYLQLILQSPGKVLSAIELSAIVHQPVLNDEQQARADRVVLRSNADEAGNPDALSVTPGGDAGEVIDEKARKEYSARYEELSAKLEHAREIGDADKADEIKQEMEALAKQLSQGVAPGGRLRRAHAVDKKAYDAVANNIRRAIADLKKHCNALGQHLDDHVKYIRADGWRYQPADKIDWKF